MPTIYDDELLYSIVARYGFITGYGSAASANMDLFGRAFGHAATVLPSNLDAVAARIPEGYGLTGRDLALRHTLLPYHCAFLPADAREKAIEVARADGGYDRRPPRTPDKPLKSPTNLRFCPQCLRHMEQQGQDLHWKRVHQLAIVVLCPDHGCDLRNSLVSPHPNDRRLHPASMEICRANSPSVIPKDAKVDRSLLLELAQAARELLAERYPAGMHRGSGPAYAQIFRDLGYYRKDRLHWDKMLSPLRRSLDDIASALPGIDTIGSEAMGWFALSLSPARTRHADRVLIAAAASRRIEAVEPRFWAAIDGLTGQPLMSLDPAA